MGETLPRCQQMGWIRPWRGGPVGLARRKGLLLQEEMSKGLLFVVASWRDRPVSLALECCLGAVAGQGHAEMTPRVLWPSRNQLRCAATLGRGGP